jgi:hypothetical protein
MHHLTDLKPSHSKIAGSPSKMISGSIGPIQILIHRLDGLEIRLAPDWSCSHAAFIHRIQTLCDKSPSTIRKNWTRCDTPLFRNIAFFGSIASRLQID